MEIDDFYEFDSSYQKKVPFPASHHTTPLTYYPQRLVIEYFKGEEKNEQTPIVARGIRMCRYVASKLKTNLSVTDDPTDFYYYCLNTVCSSEVCPPNDIAVRRLSSSLIASVSLAKSEIKGLEHLHPYLSGKLPCLGTLTEEHNVICQSVSVSCSLGDFLRGVRNKCQYKAVTKDESIGTSSWNDLVLHFSCYELIVVRLGRSKKMILISYDQFLMIMDTVLSRLVVKATCIISSFLGETVLPSWPCVRQIYSWGDNIIKCYGMKGYKIIGMYEDFVTSVFVNFEGSDPLGLGISHTETMLSEAGDIQEEDSIPVAHTVEILQLLKDVGCPNILSELFGLRKHWGNPMVDASKSGEAVQEKLLEDFPVSAIGSVRLLASFNRMITVEFIKKHGEWPKGEFRAGSKHTPLAEAHRTNTCRLPEQSLDHRMEHWAHFVFHSNCVINTFSDSLSLLSDKSVSLPRESLDLVYEKTRVSYDLPESCENQRRLILEFLRKDQLSVIDIFKIVMTGKIPFNWLANSASMKGTEMKYEKARIFAVLTYELRQYFAASEELIKDHIFPYNPHQTMTLNEVDLIGKLRDITSQMDPETKSQYLYVIHIIDFSKWNLRMKYENTCGVFKSIDDFLGTPGLIESSHDIFMSMLNLVQDRYNPPDRPVEETDSSTIWRMHNRGWEGQRQKGWTALTSANLAAMELETGIHSEIIGQGDNQVLLSRFKIPEQHRNPSEWITFNPTEVRTLLDEFYQILEERCLDIGLKIKTGESCRSLSYFNYGKRLYFNGIELSMMLKRLSKVITEPNSAYPTSESIFKTMSGTEFAAGLYSHPSVVPVLISNLFNGLQIHSSYAENPLISKEGAELLNSKNLRLNSRFLSTLMSIPPCLGGVPSASLITGSYRGHPDPLCEDVVVLKVKADGGDEICKKILILAEQGVWFNDVTDESKEQLIFAPYSLNLAMPVSALSPLKHAVMPAVMTYCKNESVKELFSEQLNVDEADILEALSGVEPFCPLIVNDIFERTLPGRRKSFVSGLSNTTSLTRLVSSSGDSNLLYKVTSGESNQISWWTTLVYDIENFSLHGVQYTLDAHHIVAQRLRDTSWGCEIVGVTVPHPAEQFSMSETEHACCTTMCSSYETEHIVLVYMCEDIAGVCGPKSEKVQLNKMRHHKPYTGNRISEGIIQKQVVNLAHSDSFQDILRMNTLRKWISKDGSNLSEAILTLIRTRTDVGMDLIDKATGTPSRLSHNHRAALMATKKTCASSSTNNISSRMYLSSNLMGEYSHGSVNYSLPYGPTFLFGQYMIALTKVYSFDEAVGREIVHMHVRESNVPVVYDGSLDINQKLILTGPDLSSCPLYIKFSQLILQDRSSNVLGEIWQKKESLNEYKRRMAYCSQLIGNSLLEETILREQISQTVRSSFVKRGISISVGDINLVSVSVLVTCLANHIFILLPYSLQTLYSADHFFPAVCEFLDKFSESFFSQFTNALINPRLIKDLIKLSPNSVRAMSARNSKFLNVVLKDSILERMWRLRCSAVASLKAKYSSPLLLFAPSIMSLRYLYAKWVETHLLLMSESVLVNKKEFFGFVRDFSYNIQSAPGADIMSIVYLVMHDFKEINLRLFDQVKYYIQTPICISLSEAWVDTLRVPLILKEASEPSRNDVWETEEDMDLEGLFQGEGDGFYKPEQLIVRNIRDYSWSREFSTPLSVLYVPRRICDCVPMTSVVELRGETFFMPTGQLSKSHYRFLDRVMSLKLECVNVMCLGTSTGTEAAAFSNMESVSLIYTNCLNDLRMFSDHVAATSIPSAFYLDGLPHKLIKTVESSLTEGDLLKSNTVEAILKHTDGILWSGITCDAELPRETTLDTKLNMLRNLVSIFMARVEERGWIIVKVAACCHHDLEVLTSFFCKFFFEVNVTHSCYSGLHQNLFMFTSRGSKRKDAVSFNSSVIASTLNGDKDLKELYLLPFETNRPSFLNLNQDEKRERKYLNSFLKSGLEVAIGVFLRGVATVTNWDIEDRVSGGVKLISYQESLLEICSDLLFTAKKIYDGGTMPRSSILMGSDSPLISQINNVLLKVHRAELLRTILQIEALSYEGVESIIQNWLYTRKSYKIRGHDFVVKVDISRFYQFYSRYLMEVLGHFFSGSMSITQQPTESFYGCHLIGTKRVIRVEYIDFRPCERTSLTRPPDDRWSWPRRTEFFFCLQVSKILSKADLSIVLSYPYILVEVARLTKLHPIIGSTFDRIDGIVCTSLSDETILRMNLNDEAVLLIEMERIHLISRRYTIKRMYRPMWAGRRPSSVILFVSRFPNRSQNPDLFYPNYDLPARFSCSRGRSLINCSCIDCALEEIFLEEFHLAHQDVNGVCSVGRVSSIRDLKH